MRYYLIVLLFVIMGAGARTMFEIAYQALGREHDFAPAADTTRLIFLALWFVLMMVVDVLLIANKNLRYRNVFISLLTIGVLVPTIYKFINH